jgi:hypothetical protein
MNKYLRSLSTSVAPALVLAQVPAEAPVQALEQDPVQVPVPTLEEALPYQILLMC